MRLLHELIELLSSNEPSLENALFKAQVLAHRLGDMELKGWVASELRGYPLEGTLPPYRVIPITLLADLSNGHYRYSAQPLPLMRVDKRVREKFSHQHLPQSIAVIEGWSRDDSSLALVVAPEYYSYLKAGIDPLYDIERAWGKHSVGAMVQVVVDVRARLLDFALELSDRIPSEPEPNDIKQVAKEVAVSELFRNAVFGSNNTFVVGSGSIQGVQNSVVARDMQSLVDSLRARGVAPADVDDLQAAIASDDQSSEVSEKRLGPAVKSWIGAMVNKAAHGTWDVGIEVAGGLLSTLIGAYYGIGTT